VTETKEQLLTKLGFRFGANGPHAARTMMLDDLRMLLTECRQRRRALIAVKPSWQKMRALSHRHLVALYGLDTRSACSRAAGTKLLGPTTGTKKTTFSAEANAWSRRRKTDSRFISCSPDTGISNQNARNELRRKLA
jgi:hypothetical protein